MYTVRVYKLNSKIKNYVYTIRLVCLNILATTGHNSEESDGNPFTVVFSKVKVWFRLNEFITCLPYSSITSFFLVLLSLVCITVFFSLAWSLDDNNISDDLHIVIYKISRGTLFTRCIEDRSRLSSFQLFH